MSRPIRYCGDSENRNVRFVRQMVRDGIPFGSPEKADRIIGWGCAFGIVVTIVLLLVEALA